MRKYRAEQVAKWLDMRDGWRLPKWQRKILKEVLTETCGMDGLKRRIEND